MTTTVSHRVLCVSWFFKQPTATTSIVGSFDEAVKKQKMNCNFSNAKNWPKERKKSKTFVFHAYSFVWYEIVRAYFCMCKSNIVQWKENATQSESQLICILYVDFLAIWRCFRNWNPLRVNYWLGFLKTDSIRNKCIFYKITLPNLNIKNMNLWCVVLTIVFMRK